MRLLVGKDEDIGHVFVAVPVSFIFHMGRKRKDG